MEGHVNANQNRRFSQIGIDRLVRLEWLDKTASLFLAGNDSAEVGAILKADLKKCFQTKETTVRGSIDKTITVLLKVWTRVPVELQPLRNSGLELLKSLPRTDRVAVHWGMIMAVYPFWAAVGEQAGRLLTLQGTVAAAHVQRRLRERYGERETVSRRVRYVLRSYVDWGVLNESEANGVYDAGQSLAIDDPRLIGWLIEASLQATINRSGPLRGLIASPGLFPFRLQPLQAEILLATCPRVELLRHGLDDELVMLRQRPASEH